MAAFAASEGQGHPRIVEMEKVRYMYMFGTIHAIKIK